MDTWAARSIQAMSLQIPCSGHEGVCTDCGRVLTEPQSTFFGTMCWICKNALVIDFEQEKKD